MICGTNIKTTLLLPLLVVIGCAGSPPDYTPRTAGTAQEAKLSRFFDIAEAPERTRTIVVPVCSSGVGTPQTGWSIDNGNWCVVACDKQGAGEDRWLSDAGDNRCFATSNRQPATLVEVQFNWSDLTLQQPALFSGFSNSFLSDTHWICTEHRYRIDPATNKAFWDNVADGDFVYRFHRSGKLAIGGTARLAKPSGKWSVRTNDEVYFNQRRVFINAIDYGGGRFDDFITPITKQVCKFVSEADEPAAS